MNTIRTLLWLEIKRASWVLYGAAVATVLFAIVLYSIPGSTTGLDLVNIPVSGEEQDASGQAQMEIEHEENEGGSSFSWSFSKSWGDEPDASAQRTQASDPSIPVRVPDELQFAFRARQFVTVATSIFIPALMLLGFWIGYAREADRGDMVTLYQSPVSGSLQIFVRFLFMSFSMLGVSLAVIAIYWVLQKSQSLSPLAPLAEALGGHADIHWGSLIVAGFVTMSVPNAAFVLLFVQMQNAYDLLGGQRLVGLILVLVSTVAFFVSFFGGSPEPGSTVLQIVSIESNAILDSVIDTTGREGYRMEIALADLMWSAGVSAVMLILSGRIWDEVEWS